MTLQPRHLSSLLRAQKPKMPTPEVPGLAYYTALEPASACDPLVAPTRPEIQALDAMYGYYGAQV